MATLRQGTTGTRLDRLNARPQTQTPGRRATNAAVTAPTDTGGGSTAAGGAATGTEAALIPGGDTTTNPSNPTADTHLPGGTPTTWGDFISGWIHSWEQALTPSTPTTQTPSSTTPASTRPSVSMDSGDGRENYPGGGGGGGGGGSTTTTTTSTTPAATPAVEETPVPDIPGEYDPDYTEVYDELARLREVMDQSMQPYTPMTDEEMRARAENEYGSYYEQLMRAARQSTETQDLALQQQRDALQRSYDRSREASAAQYRQAYSQADRQLLARGMQRSSYTGQTLSNIDLQAAQAQQALWDEQVAAETNIDAQRTQLARQLAENISGYTAEQARDVLARIQSLQDTEYDRSVAAGQARASMASQIYSFLYQLNRDQQSDQQWLLSYLMGARQQLAGERQWQQQFDESVRQFNVQNPDKYSGKIPGGGSTSKTEPTTTTTTPTTTSTTPSTTTPTSDIDPSQYLRK